MDTESLISDTIAVRVGLDWRGSDPSLPRFTFLQAITDILAGFPSLHADSVFIIYGRAHKLILPHRANPEQGTRWTPNLAGAASWNSASPALMNRPTAFASSTKRTHSRGPSDRMSPNPCLSLNSTRRRY
jgi:hypothetical protein